MQKEKVSQAREAEEVRMLDIELLHQRAIGAEEEQIKRESDLRKASLTLLKLQSSTSISDNEEISIPLLGACKEKSMESVVSRETPCFTTGKDLRAWRMSANDVRSRASLIRVSSYPICRAPIASLDCMDEFSANSQQMLDQVGDINMSKHVSVYMGNHASMPSSVTPGLRYKNLGKSGLRVPNIGLGLWTMLNEDIAEDIIMTALENGINLFDLSEAHYAKGETELGKILKKRNVRRSSVIITTKIYWSTKSDERGQSRKHIIESVKASLARLQVDYIDVVLLHKVDPVCPMEELVRAMNFVINKGYVMYWGTARWSPSEIMDAYSKCRAFNCITPVVEQTEYHMFCRDKAELYMPELYHKIGVGTMAWSAITTGKGLNREEVTGLFAKSRFNRKYSTFSWCEEDLAVADAPASNSKEQTSGEEQRTYGDKLQALSNLANSLNCSMSQLAVAWCLKNENVNCLLLGATSVEQFKENIHALQIVPQLSPVVMVDIERLLSNKPQRPPMVSTLAMRNQQNTNAAKTDAAGASTSGVTTPKPDADVEANVATPEKEAEKTCEIQ
ncbi:voltage-gated potassium channel subunit beta-2 isoform X1 [Colias croceus]|uniref:voltage-gated potassium channel subunit beta-2 isoform X1 n=1 Tax=Colias crocea TaxID=72248 RepID=UPI001E2818B9|nr:voltage-gated potassium channel subunit beta-2 isoform X1 [Colias croceus]XP_045509550.1 voltage-gated potassium channel subunit beta-2 isoform X1 [Colias croceus]